MQCFLMIYCHKVIKATYRMVNSVFVISCKKGYDMASILIIYLVAANYILGFDG